MKENRKSENTAALIRRVREDDQSAFAELLSLYEPLLHAEVARYGAGMCDSDTEDLRQLALLAFYRAARNFDLAQSEVEFGLFAKICISNALISQVRAMSNRATEFSSVSFDEGDGGEGDPARRLMEQEAAEALLSRIRSLLSSYENRVWSLYVAGLSAAQIASRLGKTPRSVENAVYRIRQKLRTALSDRG